MNTHKSIEDGTKVLICDGIKTGTVGIIGGRKGVSVAVCFNGGGHDCDGMCPNGGTYEPDYALLEITPENEQTIKLLIPKLDGTLANQQVQEKVEEAIKIVQAVEVTGQYDEMLNLDGRDVRILIDERLKPKLIEKLSTLKSKRLDDKTEV